MAALRLCLSGEMQYGVALKLTPELKRALLDAQHSGQPMRMILGKEQAKNVIQVGTSNFTFSRGDEGLDARVISTGMHAGHDASEIATIKEKLSIQRDLNQAASDRIRASKEEAENARKGRTLQKLTDVPAAIQGMKQGAAGNRSEPVRHAAKPRPASVALPKQSTQPAGADHATAAARAPTPPPMGPASHAIAPGDAASKPAGQSLPPAAAPGGKGRVKPKSKIQRAAAQHQKAKGGSSALPVPVSRPASAAAGQQRQNTSSLAIKAAETGGLRLCLLMTVLEKKRNTATVLKITQQIGEVVPRLRHPQKEEIKATLGSIGNNVAPGHWEVKPEHMQEAVAFREAFDSGSALCQWEKGPQQHGTGAGRPVQPLAHQLPAGISKPRTGADDVPASLEAAGQSADGSEPQPSTSEATTQDQPSEAANAKQQQQQSQHRAIAAQALPKKEEKAEKEKKKKRSKRRREEKQQEATVQASGPAHLTEQPAAELYHGADVSKRQSSGAPGHDRMDADGPHAIEVGQHASVRVGSPWLSSGGSPAAAAPISNGHTADPQNGTDQVLGLDSSSEASDSNPPQDPEPELDQFDHERPIDMGPIAGREQYLERTQWYYDKFEVYHMLNLRISSFHDEVKALDQAAVDHAEDIRGWARLARRKERQDIPKLTRWDRILKTLHEELTLDTEHFKQFLLSFSQPEAPAADPLSVPAATAMA
ncbi:hypothetical protein WJX84_007946 [Apatococcus fuscideae]|uniref:Uncharacterized protein n=1 Tax=Apatococcus fuscideae TaxID=2026836 RepID=A0AAW1SP23_9CHLO